MTSIASEKLSQFRKEYTPKPLSMAKAAVLAGASSRMIWFGWEVQGKVPRPQYMAALLLLVRGLSPHDFYQATVNRATINQKSNTQEIAA